jgi:carbamoyltransferase
MKGSYLGPEFSDDDIGEWLGTKGYVGHRQNEKNWAPSVAKCIADEKVVGLINGRMEFGPRALGGRSILGDARSPKMQSVMNLKIKYRESFRPFAPSCLEERVGDFFDMDRPSPYMLLVRPVRADRLLPVEKQNTTDMRQIINQARSDIPAITHVDNSARIQTVNRLDNARYYDLIKAFDDLTGSGILINTSFNVRGEPIVCTPEDAYRCFMRTEMDVLVLGSWILHKTEQPAWNDNQNWKSEFVLD